MKKVSTIDLPVLKDVVIRGKDVPITKELPPMLTDLQIEALEQQIEKIVKTQLETVLKKVTEETVKEIQIHLNSVLPQLIKEAIQQKNELE